MTHSTASGTAELRGASPAMNVLFIEDEPILRLTCVDAAEAGGHTARAAHNAFEGLRLFREWRPDAIVTDLIMPGMDGYELIAMIRQLAADIPIVVVSALANEEFRQKAMQAGATRYLVKPVSAMDLVAYLEEILGFGGNHSG